MSLLSDSPNANSNFTSFQTDGGGTKKDKIQAVRHPRNAQSNRLRSAVIVAHFAYV